MMVRTLMAITCLLGLTGLFSPSQAKAETAGQKLEGFVISADRVDGGTMLPQVVMGETSANKQKPMIRFQYRNATLYGMKLTKVLATDQGPITIIMNANGPVHLTDLTVDASAFSLKGACLKAGESVPELGLKKVTMLVHQMNAAQGELSRLQLSTVKGNHELQRPDVPKVLRDLSSLPFLEAKDAIESLMKGHLPLTCEDESKEDQPDEKKDDSLLPGVKPDQKKEDSLLPGGQKPVDDAVKPVEDNIGGVTKPVKDTIDHTTEPLKKIKKPVDDTVDNVKKPVKKVTETVPKVVDDTDKTVKRVIDPVKKQLKRTKQQLCKDAAKMEGKVPKQLGLDLIHAAQKENVPLTDLCSNNNDAEKQLKLLQNQLLNNLDLLSLLKGDEDELASPELFEKMEKEMKKHSTLKLLPHLLSPLNGLFG
ncbi:hypothetical protein [Fictibacillus terranigra]|uniref:Uncharacterized protein n=1 Tax=Fictibacillus terranigra TaxID=3058424 RepID=A0ABT8ECA9_9BACL|nr:hypothetical protein [Fictibacillus sp. CENA-BCM004]MDN4075543.1 hypothetical protein [Fictibacillus sp. CENA-BCM004]